jgi:hypothetical protein
MAEQTRNGAVISELSSIRTAAKATIETLSNGDVILEKDFHAFHDLMDTLYKAVLSLSSEVYRDVAVEITNGMVLIFL